MATTYLYVHTHRRTQTQLPIFMTFPALSLSRRINGQPNKHSWIRSGHGRMPILKEQGSADCLGLGENNIVLLHWCISVWMASQLSLQPPWQKCHRKASMRRCFKIRHSVPLYGAYMNPDCRIKETFQRQIDPAQRNQIILLQIPTWDLFFQCYLYKCNITQACLYTSPCLYANLPEPFNIHLFSCLHELPLHDHWCLAYISLGSAGE